MHRSKTHPRRVGGNLGSLAILTSRKQLLILFNIKVISARKVSPASQLERQLCVVQALENVGNDRLLIDVDTEDLPLFVNADNTIRRFVLSRDEDRLSGDTVHVDACTSLKVVKVDEAIFGDEVDNAVLLGYLHGHWEVTSRFRWEEDLDSALGKRRVWSLVIDFDDLELPLYLVTTIRNRY